MANRSNKRNGGHAASAVAAAAESADSEVPSHQRRIGVWLVAGFVVLLVVGLGFYLVPSSNKTALPSSQAVAGSTLPAARFVGGNQCAQYHTAEYKAWQGSHHALAMQEASAQSVLGNFKDTRFKA